MNHLPGYDAWLTHDPRDRDYGPCDTCGHRDEDHVIDSLAVEEPCLIDGCDCPTYIEGDPREHS